MRTKAILILSAFMLILLIPSSSSTTNQNSTTEMNTMTSFQTLGFTQTHSGDTQKSTTFQISTSTTTNTKVSDTSSTSPTSHISPISPTSPTSHTKNPNPKIWIVSILLVVILVMVIVGCVHHFCNKESDQGSSVTRFLLDVRESLRTSIRNLEDHLGVRLWLGNRRGVENAMDEAPGRQLEEGEARKSDGQGVNSEVSNKEKEELKEEDSNTSDDYSSMEGDNLRERALNRQNEEDKDGDDTSSSNDEGQTDAEGMSGGNKNEYSEEIALVKSPQEDDEKADLCDVTAL